MGEEEFGGGSFYFFILNPFWGPPGLLFQGGFVGSLSGLAPPPPAAAPGGGVVWGFWGAALGIRVPAEAAVNECPLKMGCQTRGCAGGFIYLLPSIT